MLHQPVLFIIVGCAAAVAVSQRGFPSAAWGNSCTFKLDQEILRRYLGKATPANLVIRIQCRVTGEAKWRFQTFRNWVRVVRGFSVFLQIKCENGGKISLPWPMKANGLVGLTVYGCILTDKYADFGNQEISKIPDQLRVLEIRNSVWLSDKSGFEKLTSTEGLASLTSDYDCGQDSSIEYMVTNNVSDAIAPDQRQKTPPKGGLLIKKQWTFSLINLLRGYAETIFESSHARIRNIRAEIQKPEFELNINKPGGYFPWPIGSIRLSSNEGKFTPIRKLTHSTQPKNNKDNISSLTSVVSSPFLHSNVSLSTNTIAAAQNDFLKLLDNLRSLDLKCHFEKLRILDESSPHLLPVHHFTLMVQGARYPELRVMNYSRSGIKKLPNELSNFWMHFPRLEYLDLSMNYLTDIRLTSPTWKTGGNVLTLDIRNNLISDISVEDLVSWSQNLNVFVDIRNNPISCACHMKRFLDKIQSKTFFDGNLRRYTYIKELKCAEPPHLKGKNLSSLILRCNVFTNLAVASTSSGASGVLLSGETQWIIVCCSVMVVAMAATILILILNCFSGKMMKKMESTSQAATCVPEGGDPVINLNK